jgi:hypothetical protein
MKHMTIEERTGEGVPRPLGTDGRSPLRRLRRRFGPRFGRRFRRSLADDRGAATAEYAITILVPSVLVSRGRRTGSGTHILR